MAMTLKQEPSLHNVEENDEYDSHRNTCLHNNLIGNWIVKYVNESSHNMCLKVQSDRSATKTLHNQFLLFQNSEILFGQTSWD